MTNRDLGWHRRITRRDFLNGVALAIGGAYVLPDWAATLLAGDLPAAGQTRVRPDYPPAHIGLRGSHVGSFETFHALKNGTFWRAAGPIASTHETYDLAQFLAVCRRSKRSKHRTNSPLLALFATAGSKAAYKINSACSKAFC
jgi:hypothetical protein